MPAYRVVVNQHITEGKAIRARQLRHTVTIPETLLWARIRGNQLDGRHFRRQQVIDGFIVDFYCHSAGLVVEVDGPIHNQQQEYDALRDAILAARGLQLLRLTNDRIFYDMPRVLKQIREAFDHESPVPEYFGHARTD